MKYLLNCRSFISLMVLFSFIDNFGMDDYIFNFKMDDYISNFKVVFVGDVGVGKTQIINRIIKNTFFEEYKPSISAEFSEKTIKFNGGDIKLELWDISGQEKYRILAKVFYKNSHLIVFVYAIDNKNTFENIKIWVDEAKEEIDEKTKFLLVGNKCDLDEERQVSKEEAQKYAEDNNMKFIEVSEKTGEGISDDMFNFFIKDLLDDMEKEEKKIQVDDLDNINMNYINNNRSFWSKYCSCCPCLKKSEGNV